MAAVEQYKPLLATVLDLEYEHQLGEVLSWGEQAAEYVTEAVIIIPKVIGITRKLPRSIGGKEVRLGYSASSTFSSTPVGLDEFKGWPIHCLGGSVRTQLNLTRTHDVQSADGNYIQNLARKYNQFYSPGRGVKNRNWPMLREIGINVKTDAIYLAFELTCIAVPMIFRGAKAHDVYEAQLSYLESIGLKPAMKQLSLEGMLV